MRNLEIKISVTSAHLADLETTVRKSGLAIVVLDQVDTYFAVTRGRLKLREVRDELGARSAELISYRRPDLTGPRWSDYELLPLSPEVAASVKAMLAGTVGVAAVVAKRRLVAIRGRSRIHLDQVADLGCFLEIETVAQDGDDAGIDQELHATLEWLGIDLANEEPSQGSYADLMHDQEHDIIGRGNA